MAGNPRRILKFLIEKINKSTLLLTTTTVIGNITGRSQNKISFLQYNVFKKIACVLKQLNVSTFIQDVKVTSLQSSHHLPKYIVNYWQWYQKLTGLDKVELAKQQVIIVQNKLFECQNQRCNLTHQKSLIDVKIREVYSELIQTKRDDPKYVQLIILENKVLQEHSKITKQLEILEDQERDNFTQLSTSIKEYHDYQIINTQKFKHLSIILSAIITVFSFSISMISNDKIISDLKYTINSKEKLIENNLNNQFSNLTNIIKQQINTERNVSKSFENELPLKQISEIVCYCGLGALVTYMILKIFEG